MGLNIAAAVLEQGGDVICIDRMVEPLPDLWGTLCTSWSPAILYTDTYF